MVLCDVCPEDFTLVEVPDLNSGGICIPNGMRILDVDDLDDLVEGVAEDIVDDVTETVEETVNDIGLECV